MGITRVSQLGAGPAWLASVDEAGFPVVIRPLPAVLAAPGPAHDALDDVVSRSAGIRSPNVARFLGFDELDGQTWLVREYAEGVSLDQGLALWRAADWSQAAPLLRQMASGLAGLHSQGLIHGCLRPSNIIVSPTGQVRLADYALPPGLSEPVARRYGRPGPMSVESDLYGLGVIAYELLTGDRHGLSVAGLPASTAPFVSWLLGLDSAGSPGSADEVIAVLDGRMALPSAGPPVGTPRTQPQGARAGRANGTLAMIGAGLVAVALVAVIGTSSSGGASATFHTPPEAERELLAELRDPAFEFSGDVSVSVTILGGEDPQPVWRGSGTAASTGDSTTIAVAEDPGPSTAHHGWTATAAGQTIHWRSEGQQWSERERTPNALYSFSELFARTEYMLELGPADDQDGLVYFCFGDADLLGGLDPVMLGLPDSLSVGDYYMTYNVIVDAVSPRIIGLTIDAGWFSGADASIWHRMEVLIEFVPGRPAEIEVPDASAPQITPKPTAEP